MRIGRALWLVSLLASTACATQVRPILPAAVPVAAAQGFPDEPVPDAAGGFGVGLDAESYLSGRGASHSFVYCQTPGYPFDGCPGHMPGSTDARFSFRRHHGTQLSVANVGNARLGRFDYYQAAAGDSELFYEEAGNYTTFHWTDTLHVTSQTLRAGTPVIFRVTLALISPGSAVDCNRLDASYGSLGFNGTGTDAYGERLNVHGFCYYPSEGYYGEFVYSAGNLYPTTPKDEGTIDSAVGKSFKIGVIGEANSAACGDPRYCSFENQSGLNGAVSWRIKRETKGAGYTTDSGERYGGPNT